MKPVNTTILYIDDDQDDIEMLQRALEIIDSSYQLQVANDGQKGLELLAILKQQGRLPRLIVLDINMPRMDGKMTFMNIKADSELAAIPLVIFSTSNSAMDKLFFQNKQVEYITKPVSFDHLVAVAKRLLKYVEK